MVNQAAALEAEKIGERLLSLDIVPHIVLSVTGEDYPSAMELLNGSTLPPLDHVWLGYFL